MQVVVHSNSVIGGFIPVNIQKNNLHCSASSKQGMTIAKLKILKEVEEIRNLSTL